MAKRAIQTRPVVQTLAAVVLAGSVWSGPDTAHAQSSVCDSPATFCGRTVDSRCLSRLGAGAVASLPSGLRETCQTQLADYRDCLNLVAQQCADTASASTGTPPGDPEAMLAIWNEIKTSGDADALDSFADAYPSSPLATLARNRATALRAKAETPATEPKTLGSGGNEKTTPTEPPATAAAGSSEAADQPTEAASARIDPAAAARDAAQRDRNREAQRELARLGYAPGPADGVWGARSSAALAAFAKDQNQPAAAGAPDDAVLAMLRTATPRPAPAAVDDSETAAGEATLSIHVRYKVKLRYVDEHCRLTVPRRAEGGVLAEVRHLDCVAPMTVTLVTRPDGAVERSLVVFDKNYSGELRRSGDHYEADFGLVGPRSITWIRLSVAP